MSGRTAEERALEALMPDEEDPPRLLERVTAAIRSAEAAAERRHLDLIHGYYVTGLTDEQQRAVDRTVIAIRSAVRDSRARARAIDGSQENEGKET